VDHGPRHLADWLTPNVAGLPLPAESPLAYWFGAICIKLFGWLLGDPLAARISTIGCFLVGSLSIWYTTYLLGRRPDAQPLKLAFGGQPEPKDFGRTLADGAFLIYLGFLGLLLHSHETSPKTLQIALVAYAMYGAARVFDAGKLRHAFWLGLALGMLVLTYGWLLPAGVLIALLVLARCARMAAPAPAAVVSLPLALLIAAWVVALHKLIPARSRQPVRAVDELEHLPVEPSHPGHRGLPRQVRRLVRLAGLALRRLGAVRLAAPAGFAAYRAAAGLPDPHHAADPDQRASRRRHAAAAAAGAGDPGRLRPAHHEARRHQCGGLVLGDDADHLGRLHLDRLDRQGNRLAGQIARNAYKLAPGFKPGFEWISLAIAVAATIAWIVVVHWRISRRPSVCGARWCCLRAA
jgi:hypothetical protein